MKAGPNGLPAPPPEITALAGVGELLLRVPAADNYAEDQKRACLACALRMQSPQLGDILERLHKLATPLWCKGRNPEMTVLKAIAVLLDVRSNGGSLTIDSLVWRLARERAWRRDHRLRALAMLLQSSSAEVDELLKLVMRTPQSILMGALCVLIDADAGASRDKVQQHIVLRLDRGRLPPAVAAASGKILGLLLRCEPNEAKVVAHTQNSGWGEDAAEAARRIVQQAGDAASEAPDPAATTAHREPRDRPPQAAPQSASQRAAEPSSEARRAATAASPPAKVGWSSAVAGRAASSALGHSSKAASAAAAPAAAVKTPAPSKAAAPPQHAPAAAVKSGAPSKAASPPSAQHAPGTAPKAAAPSKAATAQHAPATAAKASAAKALAPSKAGLAAPPPPPHAPATAPKTPSKAAGGSVQHAPATAAKSSASKAPAAPQQAPATAVKASAPSKAEAPTGEGAGADEKAGWGALKALLEEEDEEVLPEAKQSPGQKTRAEAAEDDEEDGDEQEEDDGEASEEEKASKEEADEESEAATDEDAGVFNVSDLDDEDQDPASIISDCTDELESYRGSDIDLLDVPEDSDAESGGADSDEGIDLGSRGLLTSMFSGGSLHSEDKSLAALSKGRKPGIRVVFPSLLWHSKEVLVINKPADWICSAADVDKKRGRQLDPYEKASSKGFKVLNDLLQYQFSEREKKYIHWWIQLFHNMDEAAFPTLFDEDQNYGLCHRLDRETSGTVLVGLSLEGRLQMRECFHRHFVRKLYVCLVHRLVTPKEQTIDRQLEAMGQKARLHPNGKRARTHVRVLGYYTRTKHGRTTDFSLCTCEIAEGRMHQIRLHMSGALGAPIVSEFYYQNPQQMVEDRRWCKRTFLHAYAVGFPDVGGPNRIGGNGVDGAELKLDDAQQEWHCCVCPLTLELREALSDLEPKDDESSKLRETIANCGLLNSNHEEIHVRGTAARKKEIDAVFFPWSSKVNPIEAGDLTAPRLPYSGKGHGRGPLNGLGPSNLGAVGSTMPVRPKAKPHLRDGMERLRPREANSMSPRHHERGRKRLPVTSRGRPRSGPPPPPRPWNSDMLGRRSRSMSQMGEPPPPLRQGRRGRSRSRPTRRRSMSRRRQPGAPPSPRRSVSGPPQRRKRRRLQSPASVSPAALHDRGPKGRGPPPPLLARGRRPMRAAGTGNGGGGSQAGPR